MFSKIVLFPTAMGFVSTQPVFMPELQTLPADSGRFQNHDAASADKEPSLFWNLQLFASKERL